MSIVVELHNPDCSDYPTILLPPRGGGGRVALQAAKRQDRTGVCVCVFVCVCVRARACASLCCGQLTV